MRGVRVVRVVVGLGLGWMVAVGSLSDTYLYHVYTECFDAEH